MLADCCIFDYTQILNKLTNQCVAEVKCTHFRLLATAACGVPFSAICIPFHESDQHTNDILGGIGDIYTYGGSVLPISTFGQVVLQ